VALVFFLSCYRSGFAAESTCYGTVSNGRLENAVALPKRGANFSPYSSLASMLGRTYLHSKAAEIVVAAYAALEKSAPTKVFVYGETGWASGGRFRPHRSHQNGLSMDFMVPVTNPAGRSLPLPTGVSNKWGYDIEFGADAKFGEYAIDFEAIAEHLFQLRAAAQARGAGIAQVILDPPFLQKLFATARGPYLEKNLAFMRGKSWWRHDEHYHVDFAIPCAPLVKAGSEKRR
jgi:penicillin-insensitive murein DD-endopeptidase